MADDNRTIAPRSAHFLQSVKELGERLIPNSVRDIDCDRKIKFCLCIAN
jgi:hypothetical protein